MKIFRALTAMFLAAVSCAFAQSNQAFQQKSYWASDYGTWQVKGQSANNYQFSPASVCTVSPPGTSESFQPFATNAPVLILDALTSNTEIVTPTSVVSNASYCGIIAQPVHPHYTFSLLSATGGLQEALNQISSSIPYAAQVVLDRNWYESLRGIPGASAAAVIAAAKGNAAAYLVDNTTAPNTFYMWNGSAYAQIAPPGGLPTGNGLVKVVGSAGELAIPGTDFALPNSNTTGTAANLSGTPALPNGTTGTTQATVPCDNSGKLATDQFVVTCAGTASFPSSTTGIVVNTSPQASRTGTEADITNLLGGVSNSIPQVLTVTPGPPSGPTAKTCGLVNGGTTTSVTCSWNIAPVVGETIACTAFGASGNTITMADSATDTYNAFGSGHTNSAISEFMQTFYTAPITSSVSTTTATFSVSSFQPGLLCNTVNGIAPSSPQDGQVVADSTTAPVTTPTLTTTQNGDYIFCTGVGAPGSGFGTGGGFTLGAQFSPFFDSINQYLVQGTAGSITPSITGSVTTSASLLCSAFKSSGGATGPTTAFTSAAPFSNDNLNTVNVKEWGAVGDGSSHPACTYLGLANLAALQAYKGGIYSFATSCTNQMDWLGTQYAVNKITATGGTVKITGNGPYIWDQTVILPPNNDTFLGTAPGLYIVGDGQGGTTIEPSVPDFGANSAMISCQNPAATPQDNSGAGSGRYGTPNGPCYGGIADITFVNPYTSGSVTVSDTSYARGMINVPAPRNSVTGNPVYMDGIVLGGRMNLHRVGSWGFRMDFNVVGDHMTWDQIQAENGFCGMYWAPESIYIQGDIVMQGHDFLGSFFAGICVDKDAQFNLYQSGEIYLGHQPYGLIKFPGASDSVPYGGGYFPFITGGFFDQVQAESIGNAFLWDDNITNSAGGVTLGAGAVSITGLSINSLFATWGTPVTTGGRNQYAWIGATDIAGLTIKNPFSCCGSFDQGGSGQIAGILSQFTGAGGGIDIGGDLSDALFGAYTSMPLVGNTRYGGYCSPTRLVDSGRWTGEEVFLDSSVTSIAAGQAVQVLTDGNVKIADGTGPIIGIAAQGFTNPGTGQCLAVITSGNVASPYNMTATSATTNGNLLVAAPSGAGSVLGPNGGFSIGTVINAGAPTSPWVAIGGLGSYIPGSSPITAGTASGTTYYVDNVLGSDSNAGTSPTAPWNTIAHVNGLTFSSGSQILFKSTRVWHEQLTVPSSSITIGAYGPQRSCSLNSSLVAACTNVPIIDGADVVTGWTVQSGTTYEAAYTSTASKGFVDSLYAQTTPLALQTSIANVNSTAGSIYSDGTLVYVHLLDGSNPTAHTIEVSGSRKYGVYLQGKASVTVNGLEIIRTAKSGYLSWGNSGATGNSNVVENSVLFNNGDSLGDSSLGGQVEAGIGEFASATDTNVTGFQVLNNWVGQMDFPHASPNFALNGIYAAGLSAPAVRFNKIATGNNFALHVGDWFTTSHGTCSAPVVASNEIVNSEGNIFVAGCPNSVVQFNYVHDSFSAGIEVGTGVNAAILSSGAYLGFNTIKHNRSAYTNTGYNGIDVNYAVNGIATGNIVADVANDCMTLEADVSASSGWILTGNQFDASQNVYFDGTAPSNTDRVYPLYIRNTSLSGGFTARNNTFYVNAASPFIQYGATSSSDQTHDISQAVFDQNTNAASVNSLTMFYYSVAGTPLPTCNSGESGALLAVSDATSPTYNGTYAGSGTVKVPVFCNGSTWTTH